MNQKSWGIWSFVFAYYFLPIPVGHAALVSGPVSVSDAGQVYYQDTLLSKIALPATPRQLKWKSVVVQGRKLLHIKVIGNAHQADTLTNNKMNHQVIELVTTFPPNPEILFNNRTGTQGKDGEWSRNLRIDATGVLVFQQRDGFEKLCDDSTAYLFPQLYDFKEHRFRPVSHVTSPSGIPTLRAIREDSKQALAEPLNTFRLVFASTQLGDNGEASHLSAPAEADDNKLDTAWSEGMGGNGRGEFLLARRPPSPYKLVGLRIIPGHAANAKTFREANRLKSILLLLSPSQKYRITFPQDPLLAKGKIASSYVVTLPRPVSTSCATVVIEDTYGGTAAQGNTHGGRTAISELRFITELETKGGIKQVLDDLGSTDTERGATAVTLLSRMGSKGIALIQQQLNQSPSALARRRMAEVLVKSQQPETIAMLAQLLPGLDKSSQSMVLEGVRHFGSMAVPHLVPLLKSGSPNLQHEVAHFLGIVGGAEARQALLEQAGQGPESLRLAIVQSLGLLQNPEDLAAVLQAAIDTQASSQKADLIYALNKLGQLDPKSTAAQLAELWHQPNLDFESRYRLLTTIGRLDAQGQAAVFVNATQSTDPILRWHAAEQLRGIKGPVVLQSLQHLLGDSDPRVREATIRALDNRQLDHAMVNQIAQVLLHDPWPMIQSSAAETLGHHCQPEGIKALRQAMRFPREAVALRALSSLVKCRPAHLANDLLELASNSKTNPILRRASLALFPSDLAASEIKHLVRLLREFRKNAAVDESAEAMAIAAIRPVSAVHDERAIEVLIETLALDPHESIRAAAARGLGKSCATKSREPLKRALKDDSSLVRKSSQQATLQCHFH